MEEGERSKWERAYDGGSGGPGEGARPGLGEVVRPLIMGIESGFTDRQAKYRALVPIGYLLQCHGCSD